MLTITLNRMYGTTILGCRGQIVRNEESQLLCVAVALHGQAVMLDLSQTTDIDQSGIRALLSLEAAGIFLTLTNPNEHILKKLRLHRVESIFEIRESPRPAVQEPDCA